MHLAHPAEHLDIADVEIGPGAHRTQDRLPRPRAAVHLEAHLHQASDHLLNLLFACGFLHGNNHKKKFSVLSSRFSVRWPIVRDL